MQVKQQGNFKTSKQLIALIIYSMIAMFFVVVGRLFWLQVIQTNELSGKLYAQIASVRKLTSPRGSIVDRNGRELAVSLITKSLYVNQHEMAYGDNKKEADNAQRELAAKILAPLLGEKPQVLLAIFKEDLYFTWLARTLDNDKYEKIQKAITDNKLRGLHFLDESKRYYPQGTLAAHILGFVGMDDIGLEGIEMSYDATLRGASEIVDIEIDGYGRPMNSSVFKKYNPAKLNNLVLTIDHNIQFVVERALDTALAKTKVDGASVIVMHPATGEILALSNRPTYNPNIFGKYSQREFSNRAVSFIYEPGSTYKPIVMASALQDGIINPYDTYNDTGKIVVFDRTISNWDREAHGTVTYIEILRSSLNTGMVHIGQQLGASKLTKYAKEFGLGRVTGIELPGEERGILFDPEEMLPANVATMSIGQGIALTSLQLIRAVATIANDGVMVQPHIVKRVEFSDGRIIKANDKLPTKRVLSEKVATQVREMMEQVVESGGGVPAKIAGYKIAGKTGTAQKLNKYGSGYEEGSYIASFVGFAPSENPEFIVLVMLDNPRGAYYGSQIAAPVFKEIMEQILSLAEVPTDKNYINVPKGVTIDQNKPKNINITPRFINNDKVIMPDVRGLLYRDVIKVLAAHKLALSPKGSGSAVGQSVAPGAQVKINTTIAVEFR